MDTVKARARRCAHSWWVGQELQNYTVYIVKVERTNPKLQSHAKPVKKHPGMQCDLRHCGPWKQFDLSDAMKTSGHSMFLMQRRRLCAGWRTCNYRATTLELFRLVEGTRYMIIMNNYDIYIYIYYINDDKQLHMSVFQVLTCVPSDRIRLRSFKSFSFTHLSFTSFCPVDFTSVLLPVLVT